ncbi:MAG: undecaprenyl/decaprenyl-phosphate alpha-N-acetylglucosaminyl 1-phosphate transferase [Planctomycetaceae bacterium]|nr:undecaprenyl/decaprenyl-phosphate alpha-N-acetylglucosaminyl 1-phosphate transferase [Planctomycetaceae bacterium]
MMISNSFLLIFAVAFMGCVLAIPLVTRIAVWAGAIDRPDHFRRIHKGATPRLGGLGLAFGIASGIAIAGYGGSLVAWSGFAEWWARQASVFMASLLVLVIGFIDDTRSMGPRIKLAGQAMAVLVLYLGGVRIDSFEFLGVGFELGRPSVDLAVAGYAVSVAPSGLAVTMLWFLGCMNVWNLIDGMDGLASGVGLLVSGTLTLVAIHHQNVGVAIMAAALAGSLAGFLLYNWHPACIFLGDSGSLLIGLLIGVIGVQGSLKGPSAISILFPILAMGLPISDTAMAIFRRWVRNLPLSSADRRHVHHLLIGLGLNPRQAALLLYCFSGFLCGVVLLGVALRNEPLALVLGLSGCLAFLLILTSRLDEMAKLRADLQSRLARGRQERFAAKVTWEAIQRIELCTEMTSICAILEDTSHKLGCDMPRIACTRDGRLVFPADAGSRDVEPPAPVSGPTAIFRLSSGQDLLLTVAIQQDACSTLAADIAFRFLQRLSLATAERLERLLTTRSGTGEAAEVETVPPERPGEPDVLRPKSQAAPILALSTSSSPSLSRSTLNWLRMTLGWEAPSVASHPSLGEE